MNLYENLPKNKDEILGCCQDLEISVGSFLVMIMGPIKQMLKLWYLSIFYWENISISSILLSGVSLGKLYGPIMC